MLWMSKCFGIDENAIYGFAYLYEPSNPYQRSVFDAVYSWSWHLFSTRSVTFLRWLMHTDISDCVSIGVRVEWDIFLFCVTCDSMCWLAYLLSSPATPRRSTSWVNLLWLYFRWSTGFQPSLTVDEFMWRQTILSPTLKSFVTIPHQKCGRKAVHWSAGRCLASSACNCAATVLQIRPYELHVRVIYKTVTSLAVLSYCNRSI